MSKPLLEAIKEGLRVAILAALGVLTEALASGQLNWKLTGIAAAVASLKALDKYIHEDKDIKAKGLLPF
jgi:hypothetical protein